MSSVKIIGPAVPGVPWQEKPEGRACAKWGGDAVIR